MDARRLTFSSKLAGEETIRREARAAMSQFTQLAFIN
jgi:hypothetical protein